MFGSLHEARAYRLAAFGVIFLSSVSFWTTSQGLGSFVGIPLNYFISFGVQSAILIIDYKIIKDYKQRKEIKGQIRKKWVDDKEMTSDSFFSWSNNLKVRFKRCLGKAVDIQDHVKEGAPENAALNDAVNSLVELFKSDSAIFGLFKDNIDKTQLSADMQNLLNSMERAASSAQDSGAARRDAAEAWLAEKFNAIRQIIRRNRYVFIL